MCFPTILFFFLGFPFNYPSYFLSWNKVQLKCYYPNKMSAPVPLFWRKKEKIKINCNSWMFSFWPLKLCFQLCLFVHICLSRFWAPGWQKLLVKLCAFRLYNMILWNFSFFFYFPQICNFLTEVCYTEVDWVSTVSVHQLTDHTLEIFWSYFVVHSEEK